MTLPTFEAVTDFIDNLIINTLLLLPELGLVYAPWRVMMTKFVTDDDGIYNKADLKDGAMVWLGSLLIRAAIYMPFKAYADGNEIPHWVVIEFLTAGLGLYGINRYMPTKKEDKP